MIEFSIGLWLGFFIGLVVFKRPQWATDLINKIKAKIGFPIPPVER